MKLRDRSNVRPGRSVVVVTALLTTAFWLLCMVAYTKVKGRTGNVGPDPVGQDPAPAEAAARLNRQEALALALASVRSAGPAPCPSQASASEPQPSKAEAPPTPPAEAGPPSKEEAAAQLKADAYTLDQQLKAEEVDPVWSPKLERQTTEAIARVGASVRLDEVTCRETLCRAKISHLDPKRHDDDLDMLLTLPVVAGQAMAVSPSNDDRSTVLYFSRRGTYLSVLQTPTQSSLPPPEIPPEAMPPPAP